MHNAANNPVSVKVTWPKAYRLIPSHFPPINLFESVVDEDELEVMYYLESMTNDRLVAQAGNLGLIDKSDWVVGEGSTPIMAPFTHIGVGSRFTDGKTYGVYYAGDSLATAVAETVYHREKFLRQTNEPDTELTMRCYINTITMDVEDIRGEQYEELYHDTDYAKPQAFGSVQRGQGANGFLYSSIRHAGGECVAVFKPKALSIPKQSGHYKYVWNSKQQKIMHVYRATLVDLQ